MKLNDSQQKVHRKLAGIVLLMFTVSFFLPLLLTRENRIAPEIPITIIDIGLGFTLLLLIPPGMMILYGILRNVRVTEWVRTLSGFLGILFPVLILALIGPQRISTLGAFSRFSPGSGMYLYLIATSMIFIMDARLKLRDYAGFIIILGVLLSLGATGAYSQLGIVLEAENFGNRLSREIFAHLRITGISLIISMSIGIPFALLTFQNRRVRKLIFPLLNVLQTIPGIALFGLLIAPLAALSRAFPLLRTWGIKGIGNTPAIIALSIYAIYPIIRYSFTAFSNLDGSIVLAAKGMGMNSRQIWTLVRFPLAAPGILQGVRVALVQTIGNATLAKLIGGDGLGVLVFEGLGQASVDMVLLGMMLIIALTLAADRILYVLITLSTPKPLRAS